MKKAVIAFCAVLIFLIGGYRGFQRWISPAVHGLGNTPPAAVATQAAHPSLLYGRIRTIDGGVHEGRLRWGGDQEAFWGNYFNGGKKQNPWVTQVPPERLPKEQRPFEIFGIEFGQREQSANFGRLFMSRFGDIARIEAGASEVRLILKSGSAVTLDRFAASDFDDGVRVWDSARGVIDFDTLRIKAIEFLESPGSGAAPDRLHGTARTRHGSAFTGFIQWDREECIGSDTLDGHTSEREISLRFDTIRSIARRSSDSSAVTLRDGHELVLSASREVGAGNRGIYVDDLRYGRVLISWDAFDRLEFSPSGSGPAYGDFPVGGPIRASVTTRAGRQLAGRIVYDLDESEVTETLDAKFQGVDYTIPFGLIASIILPVAEDQRVKMNLQSGEELQFERNGDLGRGNAGLLIFVATGQQPQYVPWSDVERIDLDRPQAMYPPLVKRLRSVPFEL